MSNPRDYDEFDDLDAFNDASDDAPTFQRLRKQTGKTVKGNDRRQKGKEFGRTVRKFHKERQKYDGNGKP